jgi:bifunctional enzyme CysN/CysC
MRSAAAQRQHAVGAAPGPEPEPARAMVKVLTCGSVDDGKSTLLGRLLWDTGNVLEDHRGTLLRTAGNGAAPDLSLLLDGLQAEREQGITIDIAWRYIDTPRRRLVFIDSPGHEQYTRNMATGASQADAAMLLVDARHGAKCQTRRHVAICNLMGIGHLILAVNKMDLVGWSAGRFYEIAAEFRELATDLGIAHATAIPVSALGGDNVVYRSPAMPWYKGPKMVDWLEALEPVAQAATAPFRMPVQLVLRAGSDFRGYAGTISSGCMAVGDPVLEPVSGLSARVRRIATMDGDLSRAEAGDAVTLQLDTELDIARGAVLAAPDRPPLVARALEARIVWLSERPLDSKASYLLRAATDLVPVVSLDVARVLDLERLQLKPATSCGANDLADCRIALARSTALDRFKESRGTGAFVLVDAIDGATVAGGVVTAVVEGTSRVRAGAFVLTRAALQRGLCADLGSEPRDQEEFKRRANEVALLLRAAGVSIDLESVWTAGAHPGRIRSIPTAAE